MRMSRMISRCALMAARCTVPSPIAAPPSSTARVCRKTSRDLGRQWRGDREDVAQLVVVEAEHAQDPWQHEAPH